MRILITVAFVPRNNVEAHICSCVRYLEPYSYILVPKIVPQHYSGVERTMYIIWIKLDRGYNNFGLDILFYRDGFPNNLSLHRYYYFIPCCKNRSYSLPFKEILKVNWIFWGISIFKRTRDSWLGTIVPYCLQCWWWMGPITTCIPCIIIYCTFITIFTLRLVINFNTTFAIWISAKHYSLPLHS